jgi:hypothetical protein
VYGQSGNDTIQLVSKKIAGTTFYVTVPAFIYGGTGKEIFSVAGSTEPAPDRMKTRQASRVGHA